MYYIHSLCHGSEEGIRSGARLTDGCEPLCECLEPNQSLCKSNNVLDHWVSVISPALEIDFLFLNSYCIVETGFELFSSNLPASASWVAGPTGAATVTSWTADRWLKSQKPLLLLTSCCSQYVMWCVCVYDGKCHSLNYSWANCGGRHPCSPSCWGSWGRRIV